jgi:hypothetical protein
LATASLPQYEIFENEFSLPRGKLSTTDLTGCLPTGRFLTCIDSDDLIKGVAGWALKRRVRVAGHLDG